MTSPLSTPLINPEAESFPKKLLPLSPPPPPRHWISRPLPPGYYYLYGPCTFQKIPAIDSYTALIQLKPEKAVAKSPIPTAAADGRGRPAVKSTRLNRRSPRVCVEERRGPRSKGLAWAPKKPKSYGVVGKCVGSPPPPPSPPSPGNGVPISGKTTVMIRNFPNQALKLKKAKSVHKVVGKCVVGSYSPPPSPPLPENGVPISGKTTVMIRNVPNKFRDKLLAFLDSLCLDQNKKTKLESKPLRFEYDFVYLPMDFRWGKNLGYAFVNFTDAVAARRIKGLLDYYCWGGFDSKKICEIKWAYIQGKEELVRHFENSIFVCRDPQYLPIVLSPPRDGAAFTVPTTIGKCLKSA